MTADQRNTFTGISLATLAAIIWSGNFIIARGVYQQIGPISLAFYRWAVASVILLPIAISKVRRDWPLIKDSAHYLFWTALAGVSLFNTLVYIGAHYTSAINLTLIGTTSSPIIATILAAIFLKEPIGASKTIGLLFCVTGVLYLLCGGNFNHLLSLKFSTGDLWVLAAAFCFAIYNTMVRKKPAGISPISFLFVVFALGTLLLSPLFIWELNNQPPIQWNGKIIRSILYLGLGASVICFWIWNIAIGRIGASRTALFGNLIPIFGTAGSVIILHEQFTTVHITSMIIVFTGIVIANLQLNR
jgi:drug/metabolite transporter (DMT)-like permease